MNIWEAIKKRRSVRSYQTKPIPEKIIYQLIDAARWGPSGANLQPWKFIAITDPEIKKEIGKYARFFFIKSYHIAEAPLVIAVLADLNKSKWAVIDSSMAAQNLMLAAHSLGLGSCFVGYFAEEKIKKVLAIPANFKVVGLITVGFPAEKPSIPKRLDVKEILFFDKFGKISMTRKILEFRKSGPLTIFKKVLKVIFRV